MVKKEKGQEGEPIIMLCPPSIPYPSYRSFRLLAMLAGYSSLILTM